MYNSCLRCNGSLGTNTEIPHLSVGRKIAFDAHRGRIWVICARCGQWNLTPLEERWEALAECEELATKAEARTSGTTAALAQTASGLELLRVGGMSDADIANWRYGRRIGDRSRRQLWMLMPHMGAAVSMGTTTWLTTRHLLASVWVSMISGILLFSLWRKPPRLWTRFDDGSGRSRLLWFWQRQHARFERPPRERVVLVLPRWRGDLRLTGDRAAAALASLLPRINGADCAGADVSRSVGFVSAAEKDVWVKPSKPGRGARRRQRSRKGPIPAPLPPPRQLRPWELLAHYSPTVWLERVPPEHRLALEMAATEEMEQGELTARAESLAEEWRDEEEIGAISDDLLLPDPVREHFGVLQSQHTIPGAIREHGWAVTPPVVSHALVDQVIHELTPLLDDGAGRGGIRHLLDVPSVRALARSAPVRGVAGSVLGADCVAVRGILFDKSPDANWKVIWHQDLTIAVREKRNVTGFGPWTEKDGVTHVQPRVEVLERMLAVRVHLDECGPENGPVRVIPGSHRHGRLTPEAIDGWKAKDRAVDCIVERGGILAFRPLILHASSAATRPAHRRVVHLEFASGDLPGGLAWYHRV